MGHRELMLPLNYQMEDSYDFGTQIPLIHLDATIATIVAQGLEIVDGCILWLDMPKYTAAKDVVHLLGTQIQMDTQRQK